MHRYVHGYSDREAQRLREQSLIIENLLHSDPSYPAGSLILEAGCGIGAQTVILARRSPHARIISVDISLDSLRKAGAIIDNQGMGVVSLQQSDILTLPFREGIFDHVFVCFVLEHLDRPVDALIELKRVLKKGGTITVIEGDHGSCFWYPETAESRKVWQCLIDVQKNLDHNPLIGRQLYSLLKRSGFDIGYVLPRWLYADGSNPRLMNDGVSKIMVPMLETAREQALNLRLIAEVTWRKGIDDLYHTAESPGGTFFYTWFKGVGIKPDTA
ncbi:MAG: class I SAM-dependent methyltransferase [Dehalococcoidales bacterium]|nr:class I SAM-dependent methyltransferase [Dehalococcoidales bacterium]